MRRKPARDVVFVERGDSSAKWLFWGTLLGAGLALLYAPRSGEETRRGLQRRLWKLRAMTEEKIDEMVDYFGPDGQDDAPLATEEADTFDEFVGDAPEGLAPAAEEAEPVPVTAREELERRLAEARARRRRPMATSGEHEEPIV